MQLSRGKEFLRRKTLDLPLSSCDFQNIYHLFSSKDTTKGGLEPTSAQLHIEDYFSTLSNKRKGQQLF
jgi:hypothetical protein